MNIYLIHALPPGSRRCYDRKEAASYVGVSPTHFDKLVREGTMPKPVKFSARKVWDRTALDRAIDGLSGIDSTLRPENDNPLDSWRRANGQS
jgi:predicted DNA-binding transcriptional regulator AlpA